MALSCPVCLAAFPTTDGAVFALHVASCASVSPPPSPTAPSHCPRCLHVYAAGSLPHEISFHEHECARVNELPEPDEASDDSAASGHKKKRLKKAAPAAAPSVSLFPTTCFLCGNGGRGLLRCGGSCARAAHQHCVDELQAPWTGEPLTAADKKQAHDNWRCAQCVRGLHRCQRCGFLGHESNDMRKCSVLDCGFFFHDKCVTTEQEKDEQKEQETVHAGFVCPRHTCVTCGLQETDMRRCKSCTVCFTMTHLRCPRGTGGATAAQTPAEASGLDPGNLFVCPRHDGETAMAPTSSPDASNSLRLRLSAGDVVLILEFSNALLPPSAKKDAPDAANHWGVVTSTEETEPLGRGNQLLSVRMFVDDRVLVVPNRYVIRVASAADFPRPVDLVRHCLQRHAMVELQLRQQEGDIADAESPAILRASNTAFAARLEALGVTQTQAMGDAELGLARWRRFQALPAPRLYDGLGDAAPVYLYVDTRGSRAYQQAAGNTSTTDAVAEGDGDVSMADADTDSTPGAAGSGGSAGPWAGSNTGSGQTTNNGQEPNDSNEERPSESQEGHKAKQDKKAVTNCAPVVGNNVMVLDGHLSSTQPLPVTSKTFTSQGVPSTQKEKEKAAQVVASAVDSTPSTQETEMQNTQDTQQDNDSQPSSRSSSPTAVSKMHVGVRVDANSNNKRPTAGNSNESAKRQKIDPSITTSAAATGPSTFGRLVTPGAASNGASVSSQLHISPMAGIARTKQQQDQAMFPKKRQQLTRTQRQLAEMPPLVLAELKREAMAYLDRTDGSNAKQVSSSRTPTDVDAFPWAARAEQFRPAFYQPTVMLGRSGLRRSGVEAVSRLLVAQDKRNITCFVQAVDAGSAVSSTCSHKKSELASPSSAFVTLDLLNLHSFRDLESVVRSRLVRALGERTRYTQNIFGMDANEAQRRLEQQRRKKPRDQTPLSIWYCTAHGSRHRLELTGKVSTDMKAWLCFCANVHHISAMLTLPNMEHSATTAIVSQPQQLAVASSVK